MIDGTQWNHLYICRRPLPLLPALFTVAWAAMFSVWANSELDITALEIAEFMMCWPLDWPLLLCMLYVPEWLKAKWRAGSSEETWHTCTVWLTCILDSCRIMFWNTHHTAPCGHSSSPHFHYFLFLALTPHLISRCSVRGMSAEHALSVSLHWRCSGAVLSVGHLCVRSTHISIHMTGKVSMRHGWDMSLHRACADSCID